MRTRRGARLTAGGDRDGRAWARAPGEPYDPDTDPTAIRNILREELAAMSANPAATLSPADIAARCRNLGADVRMTDSGDKYRIVPPADGAEVVFCPSSFRGRADRADILGHLRRNGLDPMCDEASQELPGASSPAPTPADIPKLQLNGKRPTLAYSKQEDSEPEPQEEEEEEESHPGVVTWADVNDLLDLVDEQQGRVSDLLVRIGGLEESIQRLAGGLDVAQADNRRLAARVASLENGEAREPRAIKYERIGQAVLELLRRMPATIPLSMSQLADGAQLTEDDRGSLRTAVSRLVESGQVVTHGKGSGMAYSIAPKE